MNDLLSPVTLHLLELFTAPAGALHDVRFPDADGERLRAAVDEARLAQDALVRAEATLEAARATLLEKQHAVTQQTERTVAYTRVYAADRPELRAVLDTLAMAQPARGRGRPRKVVSAGAILPPRKARAPKNASPAERAERVENAEAAAAE